MEEYRKAHTLADSAMWNLPSREEEKRRPPRLVWIQVELPSASHHLSLTERPKDCHWGRGRLNLLYVLTPNKVVI